MNILFITTGFAPYEFSENIVNSKLVLAFLDEGWDVDVITKHDEGDTYSKDWGQPWESLSPHVTEVGYPVRTGISFIPDIIRGLFRFGSVLHGIRWALRAWPVLAKKLSEKKYDVVITRSPTEVPHLLGLKIRRKYGIPWIANWNDPAPFNWPEPYKNIKNPVLRYFHKRLAGSAFKEASLNTFPSEELRAHFGSDPKTAGIQNTRILPHIGLPDKFFPSHSKSPTGKVYTICHAGNLSAERHPGPFFKALKSLGDLIGLDAFRLDIIGVYNPEVQKMAEEAGISGNVRFLGNKNYYSTLELLTGYNLLVVVEAPVQKGIFFPSKFTDYLQAGKPVLAISPSKGFMARVLNGESGGGIAADCTNPDAILKGLIELYGEWKSGGSAVLSKVSERYEPYCPARLVATYKEIFNELCS
jgi:glycosyltransferase involved in cell wall biosynthesis